MATTKLEKKLKKLADFLASVKKKDLEDVLEVEMY